MILDMTPSIDADGTKRETTTNNPRLLMLFSALLVMLSTISAKHPLTSVLTLLVAVAAAGVALLRPTAIRGRDWQRRWEWLLVVLMLVLGLTVTSGMLVRPFAHVTSPLWVAATAGYTVLGMTGALLLAPRRPRMKWVFALFLIADAAMTVALLRSSPAYIDVQVYLHDGVATLFQGHNPYTMTIPNIYRSPWTDQYYGAGVVVDGRVTNGFPYLPVSLLAAIPGFLLGDVRYTQLVAMIVTALALRQLASDRIGRAVAVLGVATVSTVPLLIGAWTEPTSVALLACLVLALERRRQVLAALLLGLLLASKQYFVVVIPIIWLIRHRLNPRVVLLGVGLAAAVSLPFFLVEPAAFWKAVALIQRVPLRADSISLLVSSFTTFGWPPPWTFGLLPVVGGGFTAVILALRAPRTSAAFAASIGLTVLVTILLSKQAFMNYYVFVSAAFLIAAVAWRSPTGSRPAPTRGQCKPARQHHFLSRSGAWQQRAQER